MIDRQTDSVGDRETFDRQIDKQERQSSRRTDRAAKQNRRTEQINRAGRQSTQRDRKARRQDRSSGQTDEAERDTEYRQPDRLTYRTGRHTDKLKSRQSNRQRDKLERLYESQIVQADKKDNREDKETAEQAGQTDRPYSQKDEYPEMTERETDIQSKRQRDI